MKNTPKMFSKNSNQLKGGFSLIELLLVIAILSILIGASLVMINPRKKLGDSRNTQRRADVNTILNAVYQYGIDNNGSLPTTAPVISTTTKTICSTTGASCATASYVDLGQLTTSGKYLASIPRDPSKPTAPSSGYTIVKDANNRITVAAPSAENGATITVTR